jgi:hypothetical protein
MSRATIGFVIFFVFLNGCAASRAGGGGTTAHGLDPQEQERRFRILEDSATEIDAAVVSELPEEAESPSLHLIESIVAAPPYDQIHEGYVVLSPQAWIIGTGSEGEEIRMTFLEPAGRTMLIPHAGDLELPDEVSATWVVRYERRNVLLTEEGQAIAIHVTPIAVRLEAPDGEPLYWISPEEGAEGVSEP